MNTLERNKHLELLHEVQTSDPHLLELLPLLGIGGLLTVDQAQSLSGLSAKVVRGALERFAKPPRRLPPGLWSTQVKLAARTGRPQHAYLLTPEGAEVVHELCPRRKDGPSGSTPRLR